MAGNAMRAMAASVSCKDLIILSDTNIKRWFFIFYTTIQLSHRLFLPPVFVPCKLCNLVLRTCCPPAKAAHKYPSYCKGQFADRSNFYHRLHKVSARPGPVLYWLH